MLLLIHYVAVIFIYIYFQTVLITKVINHCLLNNNDMLIWYIKPRGGGGGVLDVSLVGEVRRGPSYPDPV